MNSFFQELGNALSTRWKQENYSLEKFPELVTSALADTPPAQHVDLPGLLRDFLLNDAQPIQTNSGFGQPELIVYEHARFYIQILFWLDGTTDIHQHEFSGAFHVLTGSSIHAEYEFLREQKITPYFKTGDVLLKKIELLETGCTVPIFSGPQCIHSLFHLETPSATVVVRTQNDPGTSPQFNYLPPHVALDPVFPDPLGMRRRQILELLEQTDDPAYPGLVLEMLTDADFERGFFILQHAMPSLQQIDQWESALEVFTTKHGPLARGIVATLEETQRRETLKEMRGAIIDPEHRFFLALLMNAPSQAEIFSLAAQRFPEARPVDTILRWAAELTRETDFGSAILDLYFPENIETDPENQTPLLLAYLQSHLETSGGQPEILDALSSEERTQLDAAFSQSSLRPLLLAAQPISS